MVIIWAPNYKKGARVANPQSFFLYEFPKSWLLDYVDVCPVLISVLSIFINSSPVQYSDTWWKAGEQEQEAV